MAAVRLCARPRSRTRLPSGNLPSPHTHATTRCPLSFIIYPFAMCSVAHQNYDLGEKEHLKTHLDKLFRELSTS
jgi:hypothetical protein